MFGIRIVAEDFEAKEDNRGPDRHPVQTYLQAILMAATSTLDDERRRVRREKSARSRTWYVSMTPTDLGS